MSTENPSHLHPWLPWLGVVAGVLMLGCQPLPSSTATDAAPSPPSVKPAMTVPSAPGQRLPITAEAIIKNQLVALEVAQTPQQQAIGLMGRNILGDNQGMLFPFDPPRSVSFWMKNVWIDLDMIFYARVRSLPLSIACHPAKTPLVPPMAPKGQPLIR